jgi:hypothetical protein
MTSRSIIANTGPEVEHLIGEWVTEGFMAESTFANGRWWHRRVDRTTRMTPTPMDLGPVIASADPDAAARIGAWLKDGNAVVSVPFAAGWHNRATVKAVTR